MPPIVARSFGTSHSGGASSDAPTDRLTTSAQGPHPFPFRTRQLSPAAPMVLPLRDGGRVGRRQPLPSSPTLPERRARCFGGHRLLGIPGRLYLSAMPEPRTG